MTFDVAKAAFTDDHHRNNLGFLRAVAIVAVVFHHLHAALGIDVPFFGRSGGQFGVQLFFLLSGYLIIGSAAKYRWQEYAIHRACRILPAYWVLVGLMGVASSVLTWSKISTEPVGLLVNLLLLQHLFPSALVAYDVTHISWSLTVEVIWYLLAPLLLLFSRQITPLLLLIFAAISVGFVLLANAGAFLGLHPMFATSPGLYFLFVHNQFPAQLIFFLVGAYIYQQRAVLKAIPPAHAMLGFLLVYLIQPGTEALNPSPLTAVGLGLLLLAMLNSPPLRIPGVWVLAEISYSVYLLHFPVILWVRDYLGLQAWSAAAVAALVFIILSALSYHFIERPGIALGQRLAGTR